MHPGNNINKREGSGKYPGYWRVKQLRRSARRRLSAWLARNPAPPPLQALDPARIHRVIICRRNKRLGNMLFLTPLLRSLAMTLPGAQIDVLIGDAGYASLFERLPGLRKVWSMPRGGLAWPFRMLGLLLSLRMQSYDLVIEPSLDSFSNRLFARLCGGRWRLGFHSPNQWLRLTHAVTPDHHERHEALLPLQMVTGAFDSPAIHPYLDMRLSSAERRAGRDRLKGLLAGKEVPVIGFFTEATAHKRLPPDWWQKWLDEMRPSLQSVSVVQLLPPDESVRPLPGVVALREPDYRQLASVLGELALFVSADTGPMHLAAAAGAPTLGLFYGTRAARYRPLSEKGLALDIRSRSPQEVARTTLRVMMASAKLDSADGKRISAAADRRADDLGQPQPFH